MEITKQQWQNLRKGDVLHSYSFQHTRHGFYIITGVRGGGDTTPDGQKIYNAIPEFFMEGEEKIYEDGPLITYLRYDYYKTCEIVDKKDLYRILKKFSKGGGNFKSVNDKRTAVQLVGKVHDARKLLQRKNAYYYVMQLVNNDKSKVLPKAFDGYPLLLKHRNGKYQASYGQPYQNWVLRIEDEKGKTAYYWVNPDYAKTEEELIVKSIISITTWGEKGGAKFDTAKYVLSRKSEFNNVFHSLS